MSPRLEPELAVTTELVVAGPHELSAKTGEAYERLSPELYGFLSRSVRDPDAAADLLAEAFARLLVEERRGRWPEQPRSWLYRVATNLVMSRGRHSQVVARVDRILRSRHSEAHDSTPDVEVLRRERREQLDRALALLKPDARLAVLLAAQGFDGASISAAINRSETATRTLLCRSRVRLRELLVEAER